MSTALLERPRTLGPPETGPRTEVGLLDQHGLEVKAPWYRRKPAEPFVRWDVPDWCEETWHVKWYVEFDGLGDECERYPISPVVPLSAGDSLVVQMRAR